MAKNGIVNLFKSTNHFLYPQYSEQTLSMHIEINRPWFRSYNNKTNKKSKLPKSILIRKFLTIIQQIANYKDKHHEKYKHGLLRSKLCWRILRLKEYTTNKHLD